jgi:glycosyltransferase involved in cell wall biosynthesis
MRLPDIADIGPRTAIFRLPAMHFAAGTGQARAVVPLMTSFPSLRRFNPDVIHFHHIFGAGMEAVLESKILGKPLVETNHTPIIEFVDYSPIRTDWFKRFLVRYDAWFYNRSDFVSSPTRLIFENMRHINPDTPHRAVSNPIDTERFRPPRRKEKAGRPFTLLYAGRIAAEKKIDVVMRAVAKAKTAVRNIRLLIVGRGPDEPRLRSLARSLALENAVTFTGFVPEDHLPAYYAESDLFAIMSTSETQSIVAMQALACAIPVIAADAWGFKEYITPAVGFLIPPGDADLAAQKIVYLHDHPAVRRAMGKEGRKQVAHYSIAAIAATWEQIYRDVVARYNRKT